MDILRPFRPRRWKKFTVLFYICLKKFNLELIVNFFKVKSNNLFVLRSMLLEPLILVIAFFLLFMISIIYMRLDFSISVDEGAEVKMKVAGYCEKVANHQVYTEGYTGCSYKHQVYTGCPNKHQVYAGCPLFQTSKKFLSHSVFFL